MRPYSSSEHRTLNMLIIWCEQVTRIAFPPPGLHAMPTPVTTMTFDTSQELLWTGNDYVCDARLTVVIGGGC